MYIAITIWGNRISPVFDASQTLLIVEIVNGEIGDQISVMFQPLHFDRFVEILLKYRVQMLVCGAICKTGVVRLESTGITVASFLTGEVDILLKQLVAGEGFTEFSMPGCRFRQCCKKRIEFES